MRLKIGDFGQAISRDGGDCVSEGDSRYLAPELLELEHQTVTPAVDVFSLGVTIFEMATNSDDYEYLCSGSVSLLSSYSRDLEEVVQWMLKPEPDCRITVNYLLQHPRIIQSQSLRFDNIEWQMPEGQPAVLFENRDWLLREEQRRLSIEQDCVGDRGFPDSPLHITVEPKNLMEFLDISSDQ